MAQVLFIEKFGGRKGLVEKLRSKFDDAKGLDDKDEFREWREETFGINEYQVLQSEWIVS
jgi:hypothetical protein